ncbi:MAG: conserved rane protein of unknown function [Acidobacteriales bacterium]|nr:conserved rane protein of unknown function [Terriglobales bacterium]
MKVKNLFSSKTAAVINPLSLSQVLREEAEALSPNRSKDLPERMSPLLCSLNKQKRSGICFSGGGIRSATFGLGVLQGLAQLSGEDDGVLKQIDYLSTVSGGGFLGGWLTRWREQHSLGLSGVIADLSAAASDPLAPEPKPLEHLRKYSNYLSPQLGATSADTWTLIATSLRNVTLNWFILIPLLTTIMLVPRIAAELLKLHTGQVDESYLYFILGFGTLAGIVGVRFAIANLPAFGNSNKGEKSYFSWCLLPLLLWAVMLSIYWYLSNGFSGKWNTLEYFWMYAALVHSIGTLIALVQEPSGVSGAIANASALQRTSHFGKAIFAAVVSGLCGGTLAYVAATAVNRLPGFMHSPEMFVLLSVPIIMSIIGFVGILLVGLTSKFTEDEDREWWARSGAYVLLATIFWLVLATVVFVFAAKMVPQIATLKSRFSIAGVGAVISFIASKIGASSKTSSNKTDGQSTLSQFAAVLLPLFGIVGILVVATFLCYANEFLIQEAAAAVKSVDVDIVLAFLLALPLELGIMFLASGFVNVNKFSLHSMYRNRLIRAYLGASRKRNPNLFSGFDPADNISLARINRPHDSSAVVETPLHLINAALNLVKGDNLAWQQRKAESFSFSALHCGSCMLTTKDGDPRGSYQRTHQYGGDGGVTLGTAVAISGAAASPNMGYNSSPILTAVMTFFNVRLGWWLPNPNEVGRESWSKNAPKYAFKPLLDEALGQTNDTQEWIYLSDGGHFENLGLYELVLRRCTTIIVVDAGADPDYTFEDLGNAVRKIRIDMGVPIEFEKDALPSKINHRHCAIGKIDYPCVDGTAATVGTLIYIKPVLCGEEPADVAQYASSDPLFPQQPTTEQWFSESQFESYRSLGLHTVRHMAGELKRMKLPPGTASLSQFVSSAALYAEHQFRIRIPIAVKLVEQR